MRPSCWRSTPSTARLVGGASLTAKDFLGIARRLSLSQRWAAADRLPAGRFPNPPPSCRSAQQFEQQRSAAMRPPRALRHFLHANRSDRLPPSVVIALVASVLLQRSEGGALGVGGGGGFMTGRGQANALTRATAILATLFFLTSLTLTLACEPAPRAGIDLRPARLRRHHRPDRADAPAAPGTTVLDQLKQMQDQKSGGARPRRQLRGPAPRPNRRSRSNSGSASRE